MALYQNGNNKATRYLWAVLGLLFFGLGLVGTVLPLLPATPFILLAAVCFARSSKRLNDWFMSTALYRNVFEKYVTQRSMTVKAKLSILVPVTVLLAIGFVLMQDVLIGRIVLGIIWVAHVVYFGFMVKTIRRQPSVE